MASYSPAMRTLRPIAALAAIMAGLLYAIVVAFAALYVGLQACESVPGDGPVCRAVSSTGFLQD